MGEKINLGPYQFRFPTITIKPSLEQLKNDKSDDPVTVTVESVNSNEPILLQHSTWFRPEKDL